MRIRMHGKGLFFPIPPSSILNTRYLTSFAGQEPCSWYLRKACFPLWWQCEIHCDAMENKPIIQSCKMKKAIALPHTQCPSSLAPTYQLSSTPLDKSLALKTANRFPSRSSLAMPRVFSFSLSLPACKRNRSRARYTTSSVKRLPRAMTTLRDCGVGGKDCGVHMKGLLDGDATESDETDEAEP